jgi:hypothetical protein
MKTWVVYLLRVSITVARPQLSVNLERAADQRSSSAQDCLGSHLWLAGLTFLLLLTFPAAALGQFSTSSDGKGGLIITGYTGSGGAVVIPGTIAGLPVTGLKQLLFRDCKSLTSVTIPESVTSIAEDSFNNCTNLNAISVSPGNSTYSSSADGVLFNKDRTTLILCPGGKRGSYSIPNGVAVIGNQAFTYCTGLTNVTIPYGVTSIGIYAFSGCWSLNSARMPDSVTSIGRQAFGGCGKMISVTIPKGVTTIPDTTFVSCTSLTRVTIPQGVTSIGVQAFGNCTSLTGITIPNSVTSIGEVAFTGCKALTSVSIPASVTSIGYGAFQNCTSMRNAVFSGDAPTMGKGVFSSTANDFRVLYHPLAAGFVSPAWLDSAGDTYPAVNLATLPTPKPVLTPPSPLIGKKISITLKDGTVAVGKIVKVDPDGISIITDDGGGKVLYDSMTDADKVTYGCNH